MNGTVDMSDLTYFAQNWLRRAWIVGERVQSSEFRIQNSEERS